MKKTTTKPRIKVADTLGELINGPRKSPSLDDLARRIAEDILTVGGVRCARAVMMKGRYPNGERNMGGRNAASITFVIREHLSGVTSSTKST